VRLQNIDSQGVVRKIFQNKELAARISPRNTEADVVADFS